MKRLLVSLLPLAIVACGPAGPEAEAPIPETATTQRELVVPRGWVETFSVTTPDGDPADVYVPVPPSRWRRFFRDAFPVVVVLQGGLVANDQYAAYSAELARHGFAVVVPNRLRAVAPGAPPAPFTEGSVVPDALAAAMAIDTDPSSPGFEIVDTDHMGVTGHSFGGAIGLTLIGGVCGPPLCIRPAALPAEVGAAAFYGTNLIQPPPVGLLDIDTNGVAVALISGSEDGVSTPAETDATYGVLDDARALITVDGANHFGITDDPLPPGAQPDPNPSTIPQAQAQRRIARWTGIWLRAKLLEDPFAEFWLTVIGGSLNGQVTVDRLD